MQSNLFCSYLLVVAGQISCDQVPCPKLHCSNPVPVEGECCPQCANCDYYGRVYDDGQQFVSQRDPCHICVCRVGYLGYYFLSSCYQIKIPFSFQKCQITEKNLLTLIKIHLCSFIVKYSKLQNNKENDKKMHCKLY